MAHGNKKYNFEDLKKSGDTIVVNTANNYSLKNALRKYSTSNKLDYKIFKVEDKPAGDTLIERVA